MSTDKQMMSVGEACSLFPGEISKQSVMRRIKVGIDGVKLRAEFDGFQWFTCAEWVKEFLDEITNKRLERRKRKITPTECDWIIEKLRMENGSHYAKG